MKKQESKQVQQSTGFLTHRGKTLAKTLQDDIATELMDTRDNQRTL